ncbi:hypothetical protein HDU96_006925 [Phlyctochytrium bullatum]|nr:hypothetical protein HDU96_006925 [Phlyctochytrium bullatum]
MSTAFKQTWRSVLALLWAASLVAALSVEQRFLILSPANIVLPWFKDSEGLDQPQFTLQSYGIPYDTLVISSGGYSGNLPLESGTDAAKYSAIVLANGMVASATPPPTGTFASTLTTAQWEQIYAYQIKYSVRTVILNDVPGARGVYPTVKPAKETNGGTGEVQEVTISDSSLASLAGLKTGVGLSTAGLYHIPATISSSSAVQVTEFLRFNPLPPSWPSATTAGAILKHNTTREEMIFYMAFGSWSTTSVAMSHLWVQWASRQVYNGFRRIYATPQIDDVFLVTEGEDVDGKTIAYRNKPADIDGIISWQSSFGSSLPSGSSFKVELAYNGNGVMEQVASTNPNYYIDVNPDFTEAPNEYINPAGAGVKQWPTNPFTNWDNGVLLKDPLYAYFAGNSGNLRSFFWVSHTFTHQNFNKNTYDDTVKEITTNQKLAESPYLSLDKNSDVWSKSSMVTPSISGLFNGDCLRGLVASGVVAAVGDSSRPALQNPSRPLWWPVITSAGSNGYGGFTIVPRQSLNVFFNSSNEQANTRLYNKIYYDILKQIPRPATTEEVWQAEITRMTRLLMALSWQPYSKCFSTLSEPELIFHQANLRNADLPGKQSLLQLWFEKVFDSYKRIADWPVVSLKQDDLTRKFLERLQYETANVKVVADVSGNQLKGFTVTAGSDCRAPITVPAGAGGASASGASVQSERIGNDPLTLWVSLKAGSTATITLNSPVNL